MVGSQFRGFAPEAFAFFNELYFTQERAWFQANKPVYDKAVKAPMLDLLADLSAELSKRKVPLMADPKRAIFRIHRDVRFSRDKRPYKTHIGAVLTRDGSKQSPGLLYIHIDPTGSWTAAGFYRPDDEALAAIRTRIATRPKDFHQMVAALEKNGLALSPDEDALKRKPKGFDAITDPDLVDALCRRSLILRQPLAEEEVAGSAVIARLADFAVASLPLLDFGWQALGYPVARE
jgi:uncharacterized protein (TIGR02453 family)